MSVRRVVLARGELERGRGERRDRGRILQQNSLAQHWARDWRTGRGRSDKRENDESGTTARWHEATMKVAARIGGETAKRDRKRQTPKGGRDG